MVRGYLGGINELLRLNLIVSRLFTQSYLIMA